MTEKWDVINVVLSILFHFIALIITSFVLNREYNKRKHIKSDKTEEHDIRSRTQKWLNIFSILVMISCVLGCVCGITTEVSIVCLYTYASEDMTFAFIQYFLTFYQISRLQYCFSAKQVHSNFGYPDKLFVVLYLYGIVFLPYSLIQTWFIYTAAANPFFGCIHGVTSFWRISGSLYTIAYYSWDWFVLSLYIFKYFQLRKSIKSKSNHNQQYTDIVEERITFILKKVILLTFLYELYGLIVIVIAGIIVNHLVLPIAMSLHTIVASLVIYHMIEHNNQQYLKIINCVCCLCNSDDASAIDDKPKSETTDTNQSQYETGTNDETELKIHSIKILSEPTQTTNTHIQITE